MRVELEYSHDLPDGEQCPGEGVIVDLTWDRYIPASMSGPEEGGVASLDGISETCPCCDHTFTAQELREIEDAARRQAYDDDRERNDRSNYSGN